MSLENQLQEYKAYIEKYLQEFYSDFHSEPQKPLFESMEYSLNAGGKRLRPALVFEFCRVLGRPWQEAAPFAAALEMIHTYSLIHDDLPCMDNDDYRRGKLTNHKVYGEAMAVLAGDALLTDAFGMAATCQLPRPEDMCFAISILSNNAGSLGMVGGQVLDIMSQQRELSEQEVLDIQTRKTGCLINAACVLGAIAGGATRDQIAAASRYAAGLGLAFQIRDDMLDVIGDAKELGKAVGVDGEKNTFVRLYGLERCEEMVKRYTDLAVSALDALPEKGCLAELAYSLTARRS